MLPGMYAITGQLCIDVENDPVIPKNTSGNQKPYSIINQDLLCPFTTSLGKRYDANIIAIHVHGITADICCET